MSKKFLPRPEWSLAAQDWFSLLSWAKPHLVAHLPCEYNVMSVSIDPKDGYHLIEDFYNKFDTNLTTIGPDKILVFEVNMVKPDYWQMKIRLLLDANHAAALEDLLEIKQLKLRRRTQVITPTLPSRVQ